MSPYDSIQITRSGLDGTFERASVFSDFNTAGAVQIEFEAVARGQAGNTVSILVTKANLGDSRLPLIDVQGSLIQVTLNTRVGFETRASDLVSTINADADASSLVTARVRLGVTSTNIATPAITYSPLVMKAANVASVTSSFNAGTCAGDPVHGRPHGCGGQWDRDSGEQGQSGQCGCPADLGDGHDDFGRVEFERHDTDHGPAVGHRRQCARGGRRAGHGHAAFRRSGHVDRQSHDQLLTARSSPVPTTSASSWVTWVWGIRRTK